MPFKIGAVPLRRTRLYLQQGTIRFRDCVKVRVLYSNILDNIKSLLTQKT